MTIHGVWTPKPRYTVTYTWSGLPENHGQTIPTGGSYEEKTPVTVDTTYLNGRELVIDGVTYVFTGWDKQDFTMPANDVTIHGVWTPKPRYTVTYAWSGLPENHGQTIPSGGSYEEKTPVTVDTSYPAGSTLVIGGKTYTFDGWSTSDAAVEKGGFAMPGHNVTITGTWTMKEAEKFTVTYTWSGLPENHGEVLPTGGSYEEKTPVTVDTTFGPSSQTVVDGVTYVFTGWDTPDFQMPARNVTISGTWNAKPQYPVIYQWSGLPENHGEILPAGGSYEEMTQVTVDTLFQKGTQVTTGGRTYVFSGWDKADFAMPGEAVTITGIWERKAPSYYDDDDDDDDGYTPPSEPDPEPAPVAPVTPYIPTTPAPAAPAAVPTVEFIEILDDEVPLAGLPGEPRTGNTTHGKLWGAILAVSLAGALLLSRKDQEEAA